jgi:hypothetical protein
LVWSYSLNKKAAKRGFYGRLVKTVQKLERENLRKSRQKLRARTLLNILKKRVADDTVLLSNPSPSCRTKLAKAKAELFVM